MNYLTKSNILLFILILLSASFFTTIVNENFESINSSIIILVCMCEGFIIKTGYDYINYEYDYKNYKHRMPKKFFLIVTVVLNVIAIAAILLLSYKLKWLLFIGLILSNVLHILLGISLYFMPVCALVIAPNLIYIYPKVDGLYWLLIIVVAYVGIGFYLKNKKVKIYTYDNY